LDFERGASGGLYGGDELVRGRRTNSPGRPTQCRKEIAEFIGTILKNVTRPAQDLSVGWLPWKEEVTGTLVQAN